MGSTQSTWGIKKNFKKQIKCPSSSSRTHSLTSKFRYQTRAFSRNTLFQSVVLAFATTNSKPSTQSSSPCPESSSSQEVQHSPQHAPPTSSSQTKDKRGKSLTSDLSAKTTTVRFLRKHSLMLRSTQTSTRTAESPPAPVVSSCTRRRDPFVPTFQPPVNIPPSILPPTWTSPC